MLAPAFCLLLSGLLAAPAASQGVEDAVRRFDEGNMLYREGDFEGALERYGSVVDAGYASGALYYNMGNAYFRIDEVGQAVRFYEKAARWMPDHAALAHNLSIAREQTVDSFSRLPEPFWRPVWERIVRALSPGGLLALGLLFYVTAAAALAVRIRRGRSAWGRRVVLLSGTLAVAFLLLGFTASYEASHRVRAVVLEDAVTLVDRPDGSQPVLDVHEGTIIDVVTRRGAWTEVRLPNGTLGWMRAERYGTI